MQNANMTSRTTTPVSIREVTAADLEACALLDVSYETEYAWQMDVRDDDGAILVGLRTVRLPRPMRVTYPREPAALTVLQPNGAFWVAEQADTVVGYAIIRFDLAHSTGWITDLAVGRPWRRRQIGTMLLQEAVQRTAEESLQRLTVETQTKNYPSICLLQKNGLVFCGFNDRYYPNHDIGLYFGQTIRYD